MSSINMGALFKASAIGAGVLLIITVITTAVTLISVSQLEGMQSTGDVPPLLAATTIAVQCIACLSFAFFGVVGVLYAWFAKKEDPELDAGMAALGGGLAAVADGFFYGLLGMVSGFISSAMMAQSLATETDFGTGALSFGVSGVTSLVSGMIGICMAVVISSILGAIGAALYTMIATPKRDPQAY